LSEKKIRVTNDYSNKCVDEKQGDQSLLKNPGRRAKEQGKNPALLYNPLDSLSTIYVKRSPGSALSHSMTAKRLF
jgi:hypothetical protein